MQKDIKEYIFDFLKIFFDGMQNEGVNHKIYRKDIDENFVMIINSNIKGDLSLNECEKLADICLANEWLEHTVMGGKYGQLRLTTAGFGVVKSKQVQKESREKRSLLKKTSDYVNDHSGVFILLSFAVSLFSLIVAMIALIATSQ